MKKPKKRKKIIDDYEKYNTFDNPDLADYFEKAGFDVYILNDDEKHPIYGVEDDKDTIGCFEKYLRENNVFKGPLSFKSYWSVVVKDIKKKSTRFLKRVKILKKFSNLTQKLYLILLSL